MYTVHLGKGCRKYEGNLNKDMQVRPFMTRKMNRFSNCQNRPLNVKVTENDPVFLL